MEVIKKKVPFTNNAMNARLIEMYSLNSVEQVDLYLIVQWNGKVENLKRVGGEKERKRRIYRRGKRKRKKKMRVRVDEDNALWWLVGYIDSK